MLALRKGRVPVMAVTGYREEDGLVVLTMTRDDYEKLLVTLGLAAGIRDDRSWLHSYLGLANRLNAGNVNFIPYGIIPKETT